MDGLPSSPLERPELPTRPRGSCLVYLGVIVGIILAIAFSLLMIGFIWPLVIGFAILGVIALQYLVWGWWFERLYRPQPTDDSTSERLDSRQL